MGAWNVDLISNSLQSLPKNQSNTFSATNSTGFSSDYAKILSQKLAQVDADFQAAVENVASQNEISVNANTMPVIETITRIRPDGSIMITTYKDGKIDSSTKIKPHLVPMPDFSAPPTPEGDTETKYVQRFTLAELLMI